MTREDVLKEAQKCISGKREQDYGSPENNFEYIAALWEAYTGFNFSTIDVAMMMCLLKIARIRHGGGSGDSYVDLCGYAAIAGELNSNKNSSKVIPKEELVDILNRKNDTFEIPTLHKANNKNKSDMTGEEIAALIASDLPSEKEKDSREMLYLMTIIDNQRSFSEIMQDIVRNLEHKLNTIESKIDGALK